MLCPQCLSADTVEIAIQVKETDHVKFYSCRHCEKKWWERDGDAIALDDVLSLATTSKSR